MSISSLTSVYNLETEDYHEHGIHAELSYDEVEASGPAARPLDFPSPTVFRCQTIDIQAQDHRSGTIHFLRNVIVRSENPQTAYYLKKKIGKSTYGSTCLCIVLRRRQRRRSVATVDSSQEEQRQDTPEKTKKDNDSDIEWESTDSQVVIKISEFSKIHSMRGRHLEDPIKEISAMQLLGNYHPNVLGAVEVMQDDDYLYTVTRHLPGGELYERVVECFPHKRSPDESDSPASYEYDESKARVWFRQLLLALHHYQKKGVCHRDISLENIVLDDEDRLVLLDPGMSLRVPYSDPCNPGCVTDVSSGANRRLMIAQGQGGSLMYAAPEVIERKAFVDAFASDLWSAGVVLFVMLVGLAPFKWAHPSDKRFAKISRGGLKQLISSLDIPLSPEAIDLLQGFFYSDPRERWTLAQVLDHPWVKGKRFKNVSLMILPKHKMNSSRRYSLGRFGTAKNVGATAKGCHSSLTSSRLTAQAHRPFLTPHNSYYC